MYKRFGQYLQQVKGVFDLREKFPQQAWNSICTLLCSPFQQASNLPNTQHRTEPEGLGFDLPPFGGAPSGRSPGLSEECSLKDVVALRL
jgi:hypothetical protein